MIDWNSCVLWLDNRYFSESYWWDRSKYAAETTNYNVVWKGEGFYFNGNNSYFQIKLKDYLKIVNKITVESIVKPVGNPPQYGFHGIINYICGRSSSRILIENSRKVLCQMFIGGSNQNVWSTKKVNYNKNNHVVYRYDGENEVCFVNGVKGNNYSKNGNIDIGNSNINIGWGFSVPSYFHFWGFIKLVRIYNDALSDDEIEILVRNAGI